MKLPKKPRRTPAPKASGSILQAMPGRRVRIDPTVVEAVAIWLIASSLQWERASKRTVTGLGPSERDAAIGHIRWCRHATGAVQSLVGRLLDTVSVDEVDAARERVRGSFGIPDSVLTPRTADADTTPEMQEGM